MLTGLLIIAFATLAAGQSCGGDLKGPNGFLSSPNYPTDYPNNALCQWDITVDAGNNVELEFQDFALERASPVFGCSSRDFVTISDGVSTYGPYCGTDMPPKVKSDGNALTVIFRSDESLNYRGFLATYQEIVNGPPTTPAPTTRMPNTTNCGSEERGNSGFVTSPGYPNEYPNEADCSIFISLDTNDTETTMTLNFLDVDIEGGDGDCKMDKLTVHDGPNGNFPELKTICGKSASPITTSGNKVYMRFTSDVGKSGRGFNVSWEITSCEDAGGKCEDSCSNGELVGNSATCDAGKKCCKQGPFPSACGQRFTEYDGQYPHIVGGREATPNSWPWQVSLQRPPGTFHYCGGVLLSDTWVVTAAHCVHDEVAVTVVLGEHNRQVPSGDEVRILATEIIVHEDFINSSPWPNDIALLKLTEKVKIGPKMYPACFPNDADLPLNIDDDCYITGWGDTKNTGNRYVLNELKIAPLPNEVCRGSWGDRIMDSHVCLGDGSAGSCQGDSGGPFVCKKEGKWTLGGVTSWGIRGCQTLGYPAVYTRVSKYLDWVTEKINANTP